MWDKCDLPGVFEQVTELANVFNDKYKCTTVGYIKIPSQTPHTALSRSLGKFEDKYSSSRNLLIVYYIGHGGLNTDGKLIWQGHK